jgi:hypothetical protein
MSTRPSTIMSIHHNSAALGPAADLLLHIWPVLDVLSEMAYVACDFFVGL